MFAQQTVTQKNIMQQPTRENTLYLPIKQVHFDAILNGTKKTETREIKETTYPKYLEMWREGQETGLIYDDEKISYTPESDIYIYNGGVYPYYPIEYKFLELAVGYAKDRDVMVVEVKKITFEPIKTREGKQARFTITNGDKLKPDENGDNCFWQVVYHLGEIVETDLKKDR